MLAEGYPWWLFLVFLAAFAMDWRLVGWVYDRVTSDKGKSLPAKQEPPRIGEGKS